MYIFLHIYGDVSLYKLFLKMTDDRNVQMDPLVICATSHVTVHQKFAIMFLDVQKVM